MKLSPNFTLAEMTRSNTADRLGLDNSLDPVRDQRIVRNLIDVCTYILEPCRAHFGRPIRPTSGYRSLDLNRAIGGSLKSQHIQGQAVDFEIAGVANGDIVQFIRDNLDYDQLIAERLRKDDGSAGWVHCSYVAGHNRNELKSWLGGNSYERGLHFIDSL